MDKTRIVHEIAVTLSCAYEEALPHVDAEMKAASPRAKPV